MVLAVSVEGNKFYSLYFKNFTFLASNFHERVALKVLLITGPNPRRLLLGFMVATSILSLFISNTATTALMVPIIVAVIRELERCRQRFVLTSN